MKDNLTGFSPFITETNRDIHHSSTYLGITADYKKPLKPLKSTIGHEKLV